MEQQVAVTQEKNSLFKHTLMNPMVRKLDRVTEQDSEHSATYSGIVAKTFFFLLLTGVGAALYFVVHQIFIADAVIEITDYSISLQESGVLLLALLFTALGPVLIWLIRPLIPVTGGLYCLGQGYVVAAMCCISGREYSGSAWLSFILTVVIVAVMLLLYVKKVIQVTAKFRSVVTTLFVTSVVFSLGMLLCALIPPLKPLYDFFTQNMIVNILSGVVLLALNNSRVISPSKPGSTHPAFWIKRPSRPIELRPSTKAVRSSLREKYSIVLARTNCPGRRR